MLTDIAFRFLLVSLKIQEDLEWITKIGGIPMFSRTTNDLDLSGAYYGTLKRIMAQGEEKAKLGVAALMWIAHSERPLHVDEICHAVAIRVGSKDLSNGIPGISTLQRYCLGLIAIDKDTSTVMLSHPTLEWYPRAHPDLFDRAHPTMAEICLTYLNFQRINDLPASPPPDPRGTPFLEYSSLYWGTHMKMEVSNISKTLALQLLDRFDDHTSARSLWNSISRELTNSPTPDLKPFSALHCISYFGIAEVANTLIEMKRWDVNQRDSAGMTPLIWASRYGHEEVVGLLLRQKHIQPDQQDTNYGRTALSWAAENGHEGVVRLFLGPGLANPGSTGRRREKARRVVGQLIGRTYFNPGSSSGSGLTPLSGAAENGREGVVKPLLGREGVDFDARDTEFGRTPLSWAAGNGHKTVVQLLLEQGYANPDSSSKSGRTPLLWAAMNGHEGVVELLSKRDDVQPDTPDTAFGQTPLAWAAMNGHERVVRLLLDRRRVDPNRLSKSGQTPLTLAAENGHDGVVDMLRASQSRRIW